ncbi:hypothetical protein D3C75_1079530 [compost metagenome]
MPSQPDTGKMNPTNFPKENKEHPNATIENTMDIRLNRAASVGSKLRQTAQRIDAAVV